MNPIAEIHHLPMMGTVVNAVAIILGTCIGKLISTRLREQYITGVYTALGLACLAIGFNATLQYMPKSQYPILFIIALAVGSYVGTAIDIDGRFHRLIRQKIGTAGSNLAPGLIMAILLYCIGPLSILGPVVSALQADNSLLLTNATLDFISSIIFASTYGWGILIVAPILFCWQGIFYALAKLSSSAVSQAMITELLIIGGLMIVASGLSLLRIKECKTMNLLPALIIPILWFLILSL